MPAIYSILLFDELSKATVQIKVRGAIAILMVFVVFAEFLEAELILGAFLAGMIISLLRDPGDIDLVHKLEAFGFGFFIPVFFILVGVDLDIPALFESPESLLALPGFFLISLIVKLTPMVLPVHINFITTSRYNINSKKFCYLCGVLLFYMICYRFSCSL